MLCTHYSPLTTKIFGEIAVIYVLVSIFLTVPKYHRNSRCSLNYNYNFYFSFFCGLVTYRVTRFAQRESRNETKMLWISNKWLKIFSQNPWNNICTLGKFVTHHRNTKFISLFIFPSFVADIVINCGSKNVLCWNESFSFFRIFKFE